MKLNLAVTALLVGIGVSMHGKNDQRIPFGRRPPAEWITLPRGREAFSDGKEPGLQQTGMAEGVIASGFTR